MTATLLERVKDNLGTDIFPITVDAYHSMMDSGFLREGDPVELIDGIIVLKDRRDPGSTSVVGPRHANGVRKLGRVLRQVQSLGCFDQLQLPVTLAATQEPEPDGAVIYGNEDDFSGRHPGPKDIAVVVEVANSSLNYDRTTKQVIYAAAGIPVYWIVNLIDDILEVYSQPNTEERSYAQRTDYRLDQTVSLEVSPGKVLTVVVAELFPSAAGQSIGSR